MALSSNGKNVAVFSLTALAILIPSVLFVMQHQASENDLLLVLRTQGRISFLIFLLIVAIRPLRQLAPRPWTLALLRNRRYAGIMLASAMSVHLGFIAYRFAWLRAEPLDVFSCVTGGIFYSMLYLMLITSFDRPAAALGRKRWRVLHKAGFWTLAVFFAVTLGSDLGKVPEDPVYTVLALLALLAAGTRIAAFLRRRGAGPTHADSRP